MRNNNKLIACFVSLLSLYLLVSDAHTQDPNIDRLSLELHNSDISIRRKAVIALGRASYPQSVALLQVAISQENSVSIRLEIVKALRHIVFQRFPGYPEAMSALGQAASDDFERDELVRLRASEALWESAKKNLLDPIPFLQRNLEDRSARIRLSSVQMLRKLGTPQTIDPLGQAALDKAQNSKVRLEAIKAIGAISLSDPGVVGRTIVANNRRTTMLLGHPPLIDSGSTQKRHERQISYLAAIVGDAENSSALMLQAIKSMGQVKDLSAIGALKTIIETHSNQSVRKQATRVLSHILAHRYE